MGLAPPPLLREAVGNEVLLHHSSQSPQEQAPAWIMLREDGYDFCLLCNKVATEAHLGSVYHQKNLWWYRDLGASYWQHAPGAGPTALPGATAVGASADAAAAPVLAHIPQAPPLVPQVPLDWRNPAYYECKPMCMNFWYKLCKNTVIDSHVASDRHQEKSPPLVKMVSPTSRKCHSPTGHRNRSSQGRHRRCLLWSKEPFNGRAIGTHKEVVIRGSAREQWRRACRCLRACGISRCSEHKRFQRMCLMSFVPFPRVACCVIGPNQIPCVGHHCFAVRLVLHYEC